MLAHASSYMNSARLPVEVQEAIMVPGAGLGRVIDQLKLDRTFVKDIESDPNDAAICAATIGLAHSMGLAVVAEGVETQAQADYLGRLQCDTMQGYLFSRPLPEHQALAFVHGTEGRLRPRS